MIAQYVDMNWTTSAKKRIKKRKLSCHDGTSPPLLLPLQVRGMRQLYDVVLRGTHGEVGDSTISHATSSMNVGKAKTVGLESFSSNKRTATPWIQNKSEDRKLVSTDGTQYELNYFHFTYFYFCCHIQINQFTLTDTIKYWDYRRP